VYKLVACWSAPKPDDEAKFEEAYWGTHIPAAKKAPGMRRLVATQTTAGLEGAAPGFYRVAEMHFANLEDLGASEKSPEWHAMRADAGSMIERFGVTLTVGMGEEQEVPLDNRD